LCPAGIKNTTAGIKNPEKRVLVLNILKLPGNFALVQALCGASILLLVGGGSGCKNSQSSNAISVELSRSGHELAPTAFQYIDTNPTLSDDGLHLVFVSGRDGSASAPMLKAYKSDWPAGKSPGPLHRVTTSELGSELDARISPDGIWVVLSVMHGAQTDLYLQKYDGSVPPVQITNDGLAKSYFQFSPDSKLLAWISADSSSQSAQAKLAAIGSGAAADLAQQVVVSGSDELVSQLFWVPTANTGSYILALASSPKSTSNSSVTYKQRTFTGIADAANVSAIPWLSNLNPKLAVYPSAAANQAVFAERVSDGNSQVAQIGDGLTANPPIGVPIVSAPLFGGTQPGANLVRYSYTVGASNPAPGFDVKSLALTADGATAFMVGSFFYRCSADAQDNFGSAIVIAPTDPRQPFSIVNPKLTAESGQTSSGYTEAYSYGANNFCNKRARADGTNSRIDDQIISLALNRSASATSYRLAYTTRATAHFDGSCGLLAGDTEVWLLDVSPNAQTFFPLSNNHAPIVDDDRGDQAACTF